LLEDLLPGIYENHRDTLESIDLVTCYAGLPRGYDTSRGEVFRTGDFSGRNGRGRLYKLLRARRHEVLGIICSAEAILAKWKWAIALQIPAKLFVLNENGDYFWVDRSNWKTIRHFLLFRSGLAGAGAVRTLMRLAAFPLTLAFLLLYAAAIHLRSHVRQRT
jgi:hypothetical protein